MALSSDSVSRNGQRKCQSERLVMNWDNGLETWLCGRLVGWVRARAYLRTVLRETPNWRAISRRGRPWILACCTAFQSANCRGVNSRRIGRAVSALLMADWSGSSSTGSGSRLASCRNWGWLRRWLPRRFTMRLSSGVGAMAP